MGNIFYNLRKAKANLRSLEVQFDSSGATDDLVQLNSAEVNYFKALADEELFWKQRAHVKWILMAIGALLFSCLYFGETE